MIRSGKGFTVPHQCRSLDDAHETDPGIAQVLLAYRSTCRPSRKAEAAVIALLEAYRGVAPPPLPPELEQRLIEACLRCMAPLDE